MADKFIVLLIGSGGREFAFLRKLLQSPEVFVHVAPGLSGMLYFLNEEERSRVKLYSAVKAGDVKAICQLAQEIMPDLVIVGPEDPLILGLADELKTLGFKVFGFNESAARLEASKSFCKQIYKDCSLATAEAIEVASAELASIYLKQLQRQGQPIVLKADGPALGKGVIVVPLNHPDYWGETERQLAMMFDPKKPLGFKAERVLLEHHYFTLNEWSAMSLVGPKGFWLPMLPTKDHKLFNGLNTGGMGIITPAPGFGLKDIMTRREKVQLIQNVFFTRFKAELCGVFYEGMNRMLGIDYLVEVNVRGGDPETQGQLEFLEGVPLHEILLAAVEGRPEIALQVKVPDNKVLVGVVMASRGYPGPYEKGKRVIMPDSLPAPGMIFPAGLVWEDGKLYTAGGRVLMVTGIGKSVFEAHKYAYANIGAVSMECGDALVYRTDIGFAD